MFPWVPGQTHGLGTFGMYPICYWWVSGRYLQPEPTMYSRCFHWFLGPLAPSGKEQSQGSWEPELEACIEAFLEEAEEDLEMNDLPLLENTSLLPVPAPVFPGFVPFAMSTGQHCVPPKSLLRKVYHPYKDPVGQCHCEPGGWCDDLPCSGREQCSLSHGSSWLGQSCCSTSEEPGD